MKYAIILLFIFNINVLFSEINYKDYTSKVLHDTIQIYKPFENTIGYLYVFMDVNSCNVCNLSIEHFYYESLKNDNIKVFIFVSDADYEDLSKLKTLFDNNFIIVPDPLQLYKNNYGIINLPFCYLINNSGELLYMGKPGNLEFDKNIITELKKDNNRSIDNEFDIDNGNVKFQKSLNFDSKPDFIFSKERHILFLKTKGSYIIQIPKANKFFISDSSGHIINEIECNDIFTSKPLNTLSLTLLSDETIFGVNQLLGNPRVPFILDLAEKKCNIMPLNYSFLKEKNLSINYHILYDSNNKNLISGINFIDNRILDSNDNTIFMYNDITNKYLIFGKPDNIFSNYNMSRLFDSRFALDKNGNIFEKQNISRNLNVYDNEGNFKRSIICDFDSKYWRDYRNDYIENDLQKILTSYDNLSFIYDIKFLYGTDNIIIIYYNLYYDKLSKDLDNYNFKFFIYLADEKGNRLLSNDIELPMNSIPFYIDNKRIGVSIYNNSVLKIIWYDLTL